MSLGVWPSCLAILLLIFLSFRSLFEAKAISSKRTTFRPLWCPATTLMWLMLPFLTLISTLVLGQIVWFNMDTLMVQELLYVHLAGRQSTITTTQSRTPLVYCVSFFVELKKQDNMQGETSKQWELLVWLETQHIRTRYVSFSNNVNTV